MQAHTNLSACLCNLINSHNWVFLTGTFAQEWERLATAVGGNFIGCRPGRGSNGVDYAVLSPALRSGIESVKWHVVFCVGFGLFFGMENMGFTGHFLVK